MGAPASWTTCCAYQVSPAKSGSSGTGADSGYFTVSGVRQAAGLDEAFELSGPAAEVMVIGGGEIYAAALPRAQRIHLTRVEAEMRGEALFPRLDPADWRKTAAGIIPKSPRNDFPCRFFILDRLD